MSRVVGLPRRAHLSSTPAPILVVGAVVSVQIGGALAKHVIDDVGPAAHLLEAQFPGDPKGGHVVLARAPDRHST